MKGDSRHLWQVTWLPRSEIFVASNNVSKLDDYRIYLGDDYHLLSPKTNIKIDILEGIDSIEDNI